VRYDDTNIFTDVIRTKDYNTAVQRLFFIDEAHRSYRTSGSFLFNLLTAAPDAAKIALTGTPLLGFPDGRETSADSVCFRGKFGRADKGTADKGTDSLYLETRRRVAVRLARSGRHS